MPLRQVLFASIISIVIFTVVIELVRRRRLREEYSVLWLLTSIVMVVLVLKYDWLVTITNLIGAALPTTTLFLGSLVFLMLIAVQFSIKISALTNQMKILAQDNALLRQKVEELQQPSSPRSRGRHSPAGDDCP